LNRREVSVGSVGCYEEARNDVVMLILGFCFEFCIYHERWRWGKTWINYMAIYTFCWDGGAYVDKD